MLKLLVIENDPEQCKNIVNYISQYSFNVKVYSMVFDETEAIEIIKTQMPDVILLDLNMPNLQAFNILNYINKHKIEKYINSIIAFSNKTISNSKFANSKYINSYFKKPVELKNIIIRLNEFATLKNSGTDENLIRNRITHELELLNYNFSYHGSKYLVDALYQLYINKDKYYDNLSRDVYPVIAKKYNKKANTIKCDISQATKIMCMDCSEKVIIEYFNLVDYIKPTVKQVIFTVLNKL